MGQKPETRIVNRCIKTLRQEGGFWMKVHGSAFQMAGVPDIIGCYKGHFIGIEVKRPGLENALSPRQTYILDKIEQAGGTVAVVSNDTDALRVIWNLAKSSLKYAADPDERSDRRPPPETSQSQS